MTCGPSSYIDVTQTDIGELVETTSTATNGTLTQTMLYQSVQMLAPTIQLNFRAQDLESLSSQAQTPTAHSQGSSSPILNGGAIAGIVIGAIVLIATAGAFAWWVLRRRKLKAKAALLSSPAGHAKPELEDTQRGLSPTELHGKPVAVVSELPGSESHLQ